MKNFVNSTREASRRPAFPVVCIALMFVMFAATLEVHAAKASSDAATPEGRATAHVALARETPMVAPAQPQRRGPKVGNDLPAPTPKKATPPASIVKPPVRTPVPRRRGRRNTVAAVNNSTLNVLFTVGIPDATVQIKLPTGKMHALGTTNANGRLNTHIAPGLYDIAAVRAGYYTQRQRIEVRPGNTNFTFNLRAENAPNTARAPKPAAAEVAVKNNDAPVNAGDVLERFLDPRQTDSVTLNEWQQAYAQISASFAVQADNRQLRAQMLFAQGQIAYMRGDYATALVSFNGSALSMPDSALAYYGLGNSYFATNQQPEAVRAYEQAIRLNDRLAMPYKGLADVYIKQGKMKDALKYYERAAALGYNPPGVTRSTAHSLMKLRRWKPALDELVKIAQAAPSADVQLDIGDCYVQLNQPHSAMTAYREALRLDPQSALAHFKYGDVMFRLREYAAAADALERALALDQNGNAFDHKHARDMATRAKNNLRRGE